MRRRLSLSLILLNCVFGIALFARSADSQILPRGIRHCCQTVGSEEVCCRYCCWFTANCNSDADCNIEQGFQIP